MHSTLTYASAVYSQYASDMQFSRLPAAIADLCKLILLDTLGVTVAANGIVDGSGRIKSYATNAFGPGGSAIWGSTMAVSPMGAAFANGALAHALNYDVLGAGYGGLIPPAVLAAADCRGVTSGQEVLTAMAVGIELLTRIQEATSHTIKTYDRVLDGQLQTYFGCAVAAAKVMGLAAAEIESALGLALMQAAGSMQITLDGDPEAKAFYGAFPNQCGLQSALLAREGVHASCNAFSGKAGLFSLFYGLKNDDASFCSNLGQDYLMRRVRFKRWPASAAFAELVDAAIDIRTKEHLQPDQISRVVVATDPTLRVWFEPREARCAPPNAAAAGNSAPFVIAAALANNAFTLDDLTRNGLRQARVCRIAKSIDAQFDKHPGEKSELTVLTSNGLEFRRLLDLGARSPLPWLSPDEVREKFMTCLAYGKVASLTARGPEIFSLVERLEDVRDCRLLSHALIDAVSDRNPVR